MAQTANITGYTMGWTDPFILQYDWSRTLFFEKSGNDPLIIESSWFNRKINFICALHKYKLRVMDSLFTIKY
jgi:hypothetical protein